MRDVVGDEYRQGPAPYDAIHQRVGLAPDVRQPAERADPGEHQVERSRRQDLGGPVYIAPVVAQGKMFVLTDNAKLIEVFVRRGIIPDAGGCYLLPRIVGPQRAKELMFLGDDLRAACDKASDYVHRALLSGYRPGLGHVVVLDHFGAADRTPVA